MSWSVGRDACAFLEDRLHRAIQAARERLALGIDVAVEATPTATAKEPRSQAKKSPPKRRKRRPMTPGEQLKVVFASPGVLRPRNADFD